MNLYVSPVLHATKHVEDFIENMPPDAWCTEAIHKSLELFGESTVVFIALINTESVERNLTPAPQSLHHYSATSLLMF